MGAPNEEDAAAALAVIDPPVADPPPRRRELVVCERIAGSRWTNLQSSHSEATVSEQSRPPHLRTASQQHATCSVDSCARGDRILPPPPSFPFSSAAAGCTLEDRGARAARMRVQSPRLHATTMRGGGGEADSPASKQRRQGGTSQGTVGRFRSVVGSLHLVTQGKHQRRRNPSRMFDVSGGDGVRCFRASPRHRRRASTRPSPLLL